MLLQACVPAYELRPTLEALEVPKDADFIYESAEERERHPNRYFYEVPAASFGPLPRIVLEPRVRTELDENADLADSGVQARALLRTRILIDSGSFHEIANYRVELQDSRELFSARDEPETAPLDVRQAYLFLSTARGLWGVKLGRQEIDLGSSRLLGANWYDNLGVSFDGVRLTLADLWSRFEPRQWSWRADFFAAAAVEHDAGAFDGSHLPRRIAGAWYSDRRIYPLRADGALLYTWGESAGPDESLVTLAGALSGLRLTRTEGLSFEAELAVQLGRLGGLDHLAAMGAGSVAYVWPTPWEVRLSARAVYASGDRDPSDEKSGAFVAPFPGDLRADTGLLGLVGLRNSSAAGLGLSFEPLENLRVGAEVRWLGLAEDSDYWYDAEGEPRAVAVGGRYLGRELAIRGSYVITTSSGKELSVDGGYAVFEPASTISGDPATVQGLYLQATLRF